MDWCGFQQIISTMLKRINSSSLQLFDDRIEYTLENETVIYSREEFEQTISHLNEYTFTPVKLYSPHKLEVFIEPVEPHYGYRALDNSFSVIGTDSSYKISAPSDELTIAFLFGIPSDSVRCYRRFLPSHIMTARAFRNEAGEIRLLDIVRKITKISFSLQINLTEATTEDVMLKHATSFLFAVAYNTDITSRIVPSVTEFEFGRGSFASRRSADPNNLEVPKLFYNPELIEQYNLALSSDDPFIKYIGYYHIMEYFFDEVYNNDLIKSVKEILLHPGFSTKKPKELSKIVDVVRKKTRANQDAFQGTELEALELTIKSFVSLEQLRDDLAHYKPELLGYYKTHEISFSNGDTIDLDGYTNEKLPKKIAARIYKTRNSLVHHKSNTARVKERGVYHPFKDEEELSKEMPLMRFLAEAIIIKSAVEI